MSTLTVLYKPEHEMSIIVPHKDSINNSLIQSTTKVFNITADKVIIDYALYSEFAYNTPDILVRAETSVYKRDLMNNWVDKLLEGLKSLPELSSLRVAVKAYVLDLVWKE